MITQQFRTSFSRGEVSDLVGVRTDVAAYFNAASIVENWQIYPEAGIFRSPGTRKKFDAKFHDRKSRPISFEFNVDQRYILEVGHLYTRVHDDDGVFIIELLTPWQEADIFDLQYRQSADVLFVNHPDYQQRQINRIEHTVWTVTLFQPFIPATFEADTDISEGGYTLTPGGTSGSGVTFTASGAVFYNSDVSRIIKYRTSRAIISAIGGGGTTATVTIISDFPNTSAIPAGEWFLLGSPQAALDPANKGPVGLATSMVADGQAFRPADVGKYIHIYGGVLRIYSVNVDQITITGLILRELRDSDTDDPAAAPAGSWTLEEASWSDEYGWPRALEFHQQRLVQAGTREHPTTFWPSAVDDYGNYARGTDASDALEYTIANRRVNIIRWLTSLGELFIGDGEGEQQAKGPGVDTPLGGDSVPFISNPGAIGSIAVQPIVVSNSLIFINRFRNKVWMLSYTFDNDAFTPKDLTLMARHIGEMRFSQHPPEYAQEPDSIVYFLLDNGQIACLTFNKFEEVLGWSRVVTDGVIEAFTIIPADTGHAIWIVVNRTIGGQTKRYYEVFDTSLETHSALTGTLAAGESTINGLAYLEGKTLDVIIGGSYVGQFLVGGGHVTLTESWPEDKTFEVGLHYTSTWRSLRPAIPQKSVEGHKRSWVGVALRVRNTIGCKVNGQPMKGLTDDRPYSGLVFAHPTETDYDGYLTITQDQPYHAEILTISGTVNFADNIG